MDASPKCPFLQNNFAQIYALYIGGKKGGPGRRPAKIVPCYIRPEILGWAKIVPCYIILAHYFQWRKRNRLPGDFSGEKTTDFSGENTTDFSGEKTTEAGERSAIYDLRALCRNGDGILDLSPTRGFLENFVLCV